MSADRELIGLLTELVKDVHAIECNARMLKGWADEPTGEEERRHQDQALEDQCKEIDAFKVKLEDLDNVLSIWISEIYTASPLD